MRYLTAHHFNIESALADFFAAKDEGDDVQDSDPEFEEGTPQPTTAQPIPTAPTTSISGSGGRRLGVGPVDATSDPSSSSSQPVASSIRKPPSQQKKFATLGDISTGGHEGHGHGGDDSDDDDDKQDLFAGGEKSGLAVQNPDDLKKKILEKAKR